MRLAIQVFERKESYTEWRLAILGLNAGIISEITFRFKRTAPVFRIVQHEECQCYCMVLYRHTAVLEPVSVQKLIAQESLGFDRLVVSENACVEFELIRAVTAAQAFPIVL